MNPACLPWVGRDILTTGNLAEWLSDQLPAHLRHYIPGSLTICCDPEAASQFAGFQGEMARVLRTEFEDRYQQEPHFSEVGLPREELQSILNATRHAQPWILYHSRDGGLRLDEGGSITPCATMPNHAVAWNDGQTYLVTARKYGQPWDWESDGAHESSHVALGGLPFFAHQVGAQVWNTEFPHDPTNVSPAQIAKIWYGLCEIAATTMIGETRETETSLPVVETWTEMGQFLSVMSVLLPGKGFDRITPEASTLRYQIGAAAIRCMLHLAKFVNRFDTPSASELFSL